MRTKALHPMKISPFPSSTYHVQNVPKTFLKPCFMACVPLQQLPKPASLQTTRRWNWTNYEFALFWRIGKRVSGVSRLSYTSYPYGDRMDHGIFCCFILFVWAREPFSGRGQGSWRMQRLTWGHLWVFAIIAICFGMGEWIRRTKKNHGVETSVCSHTPRPGYEAHDHG